MKLWNFTVGAVRNFTIVHTGTYGFIIDFQSAVYAVFQTGANSKFSQQVAGTRCHRLVFQAILFQEFGVNLDFFGHSERVTNIDNVRTVMQGITVRHLQNFLPYRIICGQHNQLVHRQHTNAAIACEIPFGHSLEERVQHGRIVSEKLGAVEHTAIGFRERTGNISIRITCA